MYLRDLRGFTGGLNGLNSSTVIDGGEFDGAKAYKDRKFCNMLTIQQLHRRFNEETGITYASPYPGCIATTGLFREQIPLFRLLLPPFQKYITTGFVFEEETGKRLAQVVSDHSLTKSGVYWSRTRIQLHLRTSCLRKPVIRRKHPKYGSSVRNLLAWPNL